MREVMARRTQLCALYRHFCHPSQGEHDGDDRGVVTSSRCRRRCQDKGRNGGPSSLHCRQGRVMAYRPRRVVIVSLQGRRARAHQCRCQGEGDGDGEGASSSSERGSGRGSACRERVSMSLSLLREREGERVSTLLLLLLERGRGCVVVRERVLSSERR